MTFDDKFPRLTFGHGDQYVTAKRRHRDGSLQIETAFKSRKLRSKEGAEHNTEFQNGIIYTNSPKVFIRMLERESSYPHALCWTWIPAISAFSTARR